MCPISDWCDCFSDIGVPGISMLHFWYIFDSCMCVYIYTYILFILAVLTSDFNSMTVCGVDEIQVKIARGDSLLKVRIDDCIRFMWQHNISHLEWLRSFLFLVCGLFCSLVAFGFKKKGVFYEIKEKNPNPCEIWMFNNVLTHISLVTYSRVVWKPCLTSCPFSVFFEKLFFW